MPKKSYFFDSLGLGLVSIFKNFFFLTSGSHLKIPLKRKGFFHNCNKGVNGLLNNKVQISLLFKEKIGILTAILPEEIRFNFRFSFRANGQYEPGNQNN